MLCMKWISHIHKVEVNKSNRNEYCDGDEGGNGNRNEHNCLVTCKNGVKVLMHLIFCVFCRQTNTHTRTRIFNANVIGSSNLTPVHSTKVKMGQTHQLTEWICERGCLWLKGNFWKNTTQCGRRVKHKVLVKCNSNSFINSTEMLSRFYLFHFHLVYLLLVFILMPFLALHSFVSFNFIAVPLAGSTWLVGPLNLDGQPICIGSLRWPPYLLSVLFFPFNVYIHICCSFFVIHSLTIGQTDTNARTKRKWWCLCIL